MPNLVYYILSGVLVLLVLIGIYLLSKPKTAILGNALSALSVLSAVVITVIRYDIISAWLAFVFLGVGLIIGVIAAYLVKMIEMPQMIAILNGLGGLASLIVGLFAFNKVGVEHSYFNSFSSVLAIIIGGFTFIGSLIAFLKLSGLISQKPIKIKGYIIFIILLLVLSLGLVISAYFIPIKPIYIILISITLSILIGVIFTISIGGADMPITISLLNSLSGVAAAVSGLAISELLLVAFGGIVGASGLILTQIMCRSMNKSLFEVILGKTTVSGSLSLYEESDDEPTDIIEQESPLEVYKKAKSVIIVPGYGMAIAQAQTLVKSLADKMVADGKSVKYAIHPIAGRMPGHMNVLLAEVHVNYDDLYDLDDIDHEFANTDLVIVVGANDVINPAAKTHEGTPIYGMPILNVDNSKNVFIFNYDLKPGYAGVPNPLYKRNKGVHLFLGDAKETLDEFLKNI